MEEEPQTPAPLFAFRAFKQALFGTPKPSGSTHQQAQHSVQSHEISPLRKSASNPAINSPTKGILLTPGAAANRRKTVSFGSREGKLLQRWPPTWDETPVMPLVSNGAHAVESGQTGLQAADELPSHVTQPSMPPNLALKENVPKEAAASGDGWKVRYDQFAAKSTTEMRKLVKREQLARQYAKEMEHEVSNLSLSLTELNAKVAEIETARHHETSNNLRLEGLQNEVETLRRENAALRAQLEGLRTQVTAPMISNDIPAPRRQSSSQASLATKSVTMHNVKSFRNTELSQRWSKSEQGREPLANINNCYEIAVGKTDDPQNQDESKGKEPRKSPQLAAKAQLDDIINVVGRGSDSGRSSLTNERRVAAQQRLEQRRRSRAAQKVSACA